MGFVEWTPCDATDRCTQGVQDLLDRLPKGDSQAPQDRNLPKLAPGRGGGGRAPTEATALVEAYVLETEVNGHPNCDSRALLEPAPRVRYDLFERTPRGLLADSPSLDALGVQVLLLVWVTRPNGSEHWSLHQDLPHSISSQAIRIARGLFPFGAANDEEDPGGVWHCLLELHVGGTSDHGGDDQFRC